MDNGRIESTQAVDFHDNFSYSPVLRYFQWNNDGRFRHALVDLSVNPEGIESPQPKVGPIPEGLPWVTGFYGTTLKGLHIKS